MRVTFKADIPESAYDRRDPRALFQEKLSNKVYPVAQEIVQTARANTKHQGVAAGYAAGLNVAGNKVTAYVTNDHPLFNIVEGGSRPHIIRPRNASILRFTIGSRVVWAREVHHPGTRPYRPLANAFAAHKTDAEQAIAEGVREWLSESLAGAR